jgi:hypothetical protein
VRQAASGATRGSKAGSLDLISGGRLIGTLCQVFALPRQRCAWNNDTHSIDVDCDSSHDAEAVEQLATGVCLARQQGCAALDSSRTAAISADGGVTPWRSAQAKRSAAE